MIAVVRLSDGEVLYVGPNVELAANALVSGSVHGKGPNAPKAIAAARVTAEAIRNAQLLAQGKHHEA
jgi:hypothetical protein